MESHKETGHSAEEWEACVQKMLELTEKEYPSYLPLTELIAKYMRLRLEMKAIEHNREERKKIVSQSPELISESIILLEKELDEKEDIMERLKKQIEIEREKAIDKTDDAIHSRWQLTMNDLAIE